MLIKCLECGGQVSDKATTCPHCGAPVESRTVSTPPPMQAVDVETAVKKLESIISECVGKAEDWGCGEGCAWLIIKNWDDFYRKVRPSRDQYVELADRAALSARECLVRYVEYTRNYSEALRIMSRAFEIARSENVRKELKESYDVLSSNFEKVNAKYGKLRYCSMESEMKSLKLEIGNGDSIHKCCKNCAHLAYHTHFAMFKSPVCMYECTMRIKSHVFGQSDGDPKAYIKKTELTSVCQHYEYNYPRPEKLSRAELLQYGIIRHAVAEGYTYVDHLDIKDFGRCEHCKHHIHGGVHRPEACELRGIFGTASSHACCPSFLPFSPQYYVKIRD